MVHCQLKENLYICDMERLFKHLESIINSSELDQSSKEYVIIHILSNGDEDKMDILFSKTIFSYEQASYAIVGNERTRLLHYKDKFMWLLRYGFCDGNEELTKEVFEIITGNVAIDINPN
jgi:hypothetical protein